MRLIPVYLLLPISVFGADARAASAADSWGLDFQNTLQPEYYDASGDTSASPYQYTGPQGYDEFNLAANRLVSPYERINVQAFGVLNGSDYRRSERGLVVERAKINWEKGNASTPFRLEVGDFFAQQTYRTLQRSLKGVQLELQPQLSSTTKNSIQLFAGLTEPIYRRIGKNQNSFAGGSWLVENDTFGSIALTSVYNYRKNADPTLPTAQPTNQHVNSIAWDREFAFGTQTVEAESELARFSGDVIVNNQEAGKSDNGVFAQLIGRDSAHPYDYRLRFERYGQYFQPAGAPVVPDRRTIAGDAGWRFASGLQFRARAQTFRSALESADYTDTDLFGVNLAGPLFASGQSPVIGQVDAYTQHINDQGNTIDNRISAISANLTVPLRDTLFFRPGMFFNHIEDVIADNVVIRRQLSLPVDYRFSIGNASGTLSPGIVFSDTTGNSSANRQVSPTLAFTLSEGPHSLSVSSNVLIVDPHLGTDTRTTTQQDALFYTYQQGRQRITLEADYFDRNPNPGDPTQANKVALTWTYSFTREPGAGGPSTVGAANYSAQGPVPHTITLTGGQLRVEDVAPGTPVDMLERLTAIAGLGKASEQGNLLIYDTPFYKDIKRRQRLVFVIGDGVVEKTVVAVDFRNTGDIDTMAETYARLRDILFKRYGTPDTQLEEGAFSASLSRDLVSGKFRRLNEWRTPNGVLRFGIPQRTDGQVRMEIIYAPSFPAYSDHHWGEESLH